MKNYMAFFDSNNYIKKMIPTIIEVFVAYYGEDKRDEITAKFNNALVVSPISSESLSSMILKLKKDITSQLIEEFKKNKHSNLSTNDLLGNVFNFDFNVPIKYFSDFYKEYVNEYNNKNIDNDNLEKKFHRTSELISKINPKITLSNFYQYLNDEEILNLVRDSELIDKIYNEYNEFLKDYNSYIKYSESLKNLYSIIKKKYRKEFILDNLDLLDDNLKNIINDYLNDKLYNYKDREKIDGIFGSSYGGNGYLDFFSSIANDKLLNGRDFEKKEIKNNRVKYFNTMGINLGSNYDDYVQANISFPNVERVDKLINDKNKYNELASQEFIKNTKSYIDIYKEQKDFDAINLNEPKDILFKGNSSLANSSTYVRETDNGFKLAPVVTIGIGYDLEGTDHKIIHEFNHLYELTLNAVMNNKAEYVCGWDIVEDDLTNNISSDEKREYELFNEIINEKITQEICEKMQEKNLHIFNGQSDFMYKGLTSYEHTNFIVDSFFNKYKEDIIKSRSNGNMRHIFDVVGEDNFNAMNDLFYVFQDNFNGSKYYSLCSAISKINNNEELSDKDKDLIKKYQLIQTKRDKILEKMAEYKELNYMNNNEINSK